MLQHHNDKVKHRSKIRRVINIKNLKGFFILFHSYQIIFSFKNFRWINFVENAFHLALLCHDHLTIPMKNSLKTLFSTTLPLLLQLTWKIWKVFGLLLCFKMEIKIMFFFCLVVPAKDCLCHCRRGLCRCECKGHMFKFDTWKWKWREWCKKQR